MGSQVNQCSGNPFDKGPYTADHGPVPVFDVEGHINHLDSGPDSKHRVLHEVIIIVIIVHRKG